MQVENCHWYRLLEHPNLNVPTTFYFLDPSYHPDTIGYKYYPLEMSDGQHRALLSFLTTMLAGKAMLCSYDTSLYSQELASRPGWCCTKIPTIAKLDTQGSRGDRMEFVWTNYDPQKVKLWTP